MFTLKPNMYRTLSNFYEDEKEFNDRIILTGVVPPTEIISGTEELKPLKGSLWSLDHRYVSRDLFEHKAVHSILRKKITIVCQNDKMIIKEPNGCEIIDNEKEGILIRCTDPVKIDEYDFIGNPVVFKGKRRK